MGGKGDHYTRSEGSQHFASWGAAQLIDDTQADGTAEIKDESKRKKTIALKATSETEDEEDSDCGEGESDNELALLIRKFKKFLKQRGPTKEKPFFKKNQLRGKEKEEKKKFLKSVTNVRS